MIDDDLNATSPLITTIPTMLGQRSQNEQICYNSKQDNTLDLNKHAIHTPQVCEVKPQMCHKLAKCNSREPSHSTLAYSGCQPMKVNIAAADVSENIR